MSSVTADALTEARVRGGLLSRPSGLSRAATVFSREARLARENQAARQLEEQKAEKKGTILVSQMSEGMQETKRPTLEETTKTRSLAEEVAYPTYFNHSGEKAGTPQAQYLLVRKQKPLESGSINRKMVLGAKRAPKARPEASEDVEVSVALRVARSSSKNTAIPPPCCWKGLG